MTVCDFTLSHFEDILSKIKGRAGTVSERKPIILTHDVDVFPPYALEMARLEAKHGIKATYYVLLHSEFYNALSEENLQVWKQIIALGHEIGLHYDARYDKNLELVAQVLDHWLGTKTKEVSHHLNKIVPYMQVPDSLHDRTPLLTKEGYGYTSDSAGWWRNGCLCQHTEDRLVALVHPMWWFTDNMTLHNLESELNAVTNKAIVLRDIQFAEHRRQGIKLTAVNRS